MMIERSAPSNIALIKYMGKTDFQSNFPTNSSLSYTLDGLRTNVRLTLQEGQDQDQWKPLSGEGLQKIALDERSIERYLSHFKKMKNDWGIEKCFLIESANNFPSDCGLASSASAFAALTKAAIEMFQTLVPREDIGIIEQAEYSRKGSGSSCRSFFGPFALWHKEGVRPLEFSMGPLFHQVVIVETEKKKISSSEAHRRVPQSLLFDGRPERAERRLSDLIEAFRNENWRLAYEICWAEFWDMHALFETSAPPFGYLQSATLDVLSKLRSIWENENDGPLVTMDAGPNVHLLWRQNQIQQANQFTDEVQKKYRLYSAIGRG